jgi:hypothetical protein
MAKVKNKVSKALQETVAEHTHIEQVHFDALGNHYFTAHEFKHTPVKTGDKDKDDAVNKKGAALSGNLFARIHIRHVVDKEGKATAISTPIESTRIVESVSREDIENATPESNLSIAGLSSEEAAIITKLRSKGGKGKGNQGEE